MCSFSIPQFPLSHFTGHIIMRIPKMNNIILIPIKNWNTNPRYEKRRTADAKIAGHRRLRKKIRRGPFPTSLCEMDKLPPLIWSVRLIYISMWRLILISQWKIVWRNSINGKKYFCVMLSMKSVYVRVGNVVSKSKRQANVHEWPSLKLRPK